jgi:hypothetical protein
LNENIKKIIPWIAIAVIACCIAGVVVWAISAGIPTSGTVIATPAQITASPLSISAVSWTQGEAYEYTVTLTNNGGTVTGPLALSTSGTVPSGIVLSWDSAGATIAPHGTKVVKITFTIGDLTPPGAFSFTTVVSA